MPEHFNEPIHREIYEVIGKIVRMGKSATPITAKTFLPDGPIGDMTMAQYLALLAAEATTVINAGDYGQTVYDLSIRRRLIEIGETMVATAYDADVDETAPRQIEAAEKQLFELAEKGRYDGGFQAFNAATAAAIEMAAEAFRRDGTLSGTATGLTDLDRLMGGLQRSDLVILAARPAMGKTALATNIAFHVARTWRGSTTPDGHRKTDDGGIVGFFSLEMSAEQLATRILAEQSGISSSDIRRGNIHESQFSLLVDTSNLMAQIPLYNRRHRRPFRRPARGAGAPPQAAEGPRPAGRRLPATALGQLAPGAGQPRAGAHRDHHHAQGAGQGTGSAYRRAQPVEPAGRVARRQAPATRRLARIGLDRARR